MRTPMLALGALLLASTAGRAQTAADTAVRVTFGGFVDTYYAYDVGRPSTLDRSFAGGGTFTTQPARHNEFNVNLAYVEATLSGNRLRGRLALQAGTSVQSNYSAEPAVGAISGSSLSRNLQEAYAGYQVTPTLWVDAGIFYSHMGLESWASKDNPTYTRSLVAEYSPYYSSGARLTWQATPTLSARLDVINGWQNISETNTDKGIGMRIDYVPAASTTLSYYNFLNPEAGGRRRLFNGAAAKYVGGSTTLLAQVDVGRLGAGSGGGSSTWWGATAIARQQVSGRTALVGRVERYVDAGQVNIATGLPDPFRGNGFSLGLDVVPQSRVMWRTEGRGFVADRAIFPNGNSAARKTGGFLVSALTLAF